MFCENCGAKLQDDVKFCEACGTPVKNEILSSESPKSETVKKVFVAPAIDDGDEAFEKPSDTPNIPKEKKPLSTKNKIFIIVSIVLAVSLIGLYNVGKSLANPKRIVDKYVSAISSGDYARAYEYMDIEDSEFTSKDCYAKVMQNSYENTDADILNYTVEETPNKNDLTKHYQVTYTRKGGASTSYMDVNLVKQPGKKWLLFNDYKIAEDNLIVTNYSIIVPEGASVYVDDIKLSEDYIAKSNQKLEGKINYVIPSLFDGLHQVKVGTPYSTEKVYDEDVYDGKILDVYSLELTDEAKTHIGNVAQSFVSDYITSAINKKGIDSIQKYLSGTADVEEIKERFESLSEESINEDGVGVKSITVGNFKTTSRDEYIPGSEYSVTVKYEYSYTIMEEDWFDDEIKERTTEKPKSSSTTVGLVYENGNWLVSSCYISLYF